MRSSDSFVMKKSGTVIITGKVRISILSDTLLRLEEAGPSGFEDRPTFLVINRDWGKVPVDINNRDGLVYIKTSGYQVEVSDNVESIKEVKLYDGEGKKLLWHGFNEVKQPATLPHRGDKCPVYVLPDNPRIVPPPWGALPPSRGLADNDVLSGWTLNNDAPDIYVFVHNGDFNHLKKEFLKLTGSIPLPPLWTFGFWNSLYHPYTDKEALETIERYRKEDIPLDVFVVDTDWRVGGSTGYDIEKKYFPDFEEFFKKAHDNNVRVIMNDHPGTRGMKPVSPEMLKYRYENLTKFLSMGLDTWWYDKNWYEVIEAPVKDIPREVWGQYLYWDIISYFRPGLRTVLLSMWSYHQASHRYPLWWTGDIYSSWDDLMNGIKETLRFGQQCMPYVGQDLGGHIGHPDDELYVRFLQYGCLSPTSRVHGTIGSKRYPWQYSHTAKEIVREYIKLRYRLLPVIYTSARQAYEDGTPILKDCGDEWPEYNSGEYLQYLLGDSLLIAPVYSPEGYARISGESLLTDTDKDGLHGLKGEYFSNINLEDEPDFIRIDSEISLPASVGGTEIPWKDFSIRWTGYYLVPETGTYTFRTFSSDGVRLWINNKLIIDNWTSHHACYNEGTIELEGGRFVPIKLEYFNREGFYVLRIDCITPERKSHKSAHKLWVPPGQWEDLWTGEILNGPAELNMECPLHKTPMFIKRGGIAVLAPEMDYIGQKQWDPLTLEIFPSENESVNAVLYEDDGQTLEYEKDASQKTEFVVSRQGDDINIRLGKTIGWFRGAKQQRDWILRVHLKNNETPCEVFIDNDKLKEEEYEVIKPGPSVWPWMPLKGKGSNPPEKAGPVVEIPMPGVDWSHKIRVTVKREG